MSAGSPSFHRPTGSLNSALAFVLFSSGVCALVYQTVWLREFRLIFGGAAPAAAAVLAVFMAGLGIGGWWFGRLAERLKFPLRFYVWLELAIAVAALATPYLLDGVKALYGMTGGVQALGHQVATLVQILMTVLVLGPPCLLMGGTLPAAMKFAQREDDARRSGTAFFYAVNVAGAVTGAALGTFWLLGTLGNRGTLTVAALLNGVLAVVAWLISRTWEHGRGDGLADGAEIPAAKPADVSGSVRAAQPGFVLAAAFMSGFTFFLVELVWYRVSAPLLGGSVYSFGLVLCVALGGMGIGGYLYSILLRKHEPTMESFVLVSALQAVAVILPAVIGDDFAYGALLVNDVTRGVGFGALVGGWVVIMMGLAFVPSLIAGVQFPLLISLLGRGNAGVGRELGRAYLCNTAGAILGSLLGGFVLIPVLGLRHCWILAAALIGVMPVVALLMLNRRRQPEARGYATACAACVILAIGSVAVMVTAGPTAVWFHTPIGYGRVLDVPDTPAKLEDWKRTVRRGQVKSFDGRESSVAVTRHDQYLLLTNGKADGSMLSDAPTQVMLGLAGAALHPDPRRACVIGLGTGTTVGWLADVPGMEHVDVIEIEERMQDLARFFSPVNRGAMDHPKVSHVVGDAREFLVTKGKGYDLIVSEPSNPYRAGVASLYTREFYRSARARLNQDGMLCQWVQGYEALPETLDVVIATLGQVFPKVEIWNTHQGDLLLIASASVRPWNTDLVRSRLKLEPFATALRRQWFTDTAEGFFAHCLANEDYTRALAGSQVPVNTDDLNILEFGYARSVGKFIPSNALNYRRRACGTDQMLPKLEGPPLDEELLGRELLSCLWSTSRRVERFLPRKDMVPPVSVKRMEAAFEARARRQSDVFDAICAEVPPKTLQERWMLTITRAVRGHAGASLLLDEMEAIFPEDVAVLRAAHAYAIKDFPEARRALASLCDVLRKSTWVDTTLLNPVLKMAEPLAGKDTHAAPEDATALYQALRQPFLAGCGEEMRLDALTRLAASMGHTEREDMIAAWGPHFPWKGLPLALRASTYLATRDERAAAAVDELHDFVDAGGELPKTRTSATPSSETAAVR
jgi:spermidine synthase